MVAFRRNLPCGTLYASHHPSQKAHFQGLLGVLRGARG